MDSSRRKSRRSRRRLEEEFGKTDRESIERRKRSLRYSSGYLSGVTVEQEVPKTDKPHASLWLDYKTIVRIYSVVKDAWTVKGMVWIEAENEDCDWGKTRKLRGWTRVCKPTLTRRRFAPWKTDFEKKKKGDCFAVQPLINKTDLQQ